MKSFFLLFFSLSFPIFLVCQSSISGVVLNKKNNKPIPYVNIGLPKYAQGTVSDEDGSFQLKFQHPNDTVFISAIGFQTQKISVNKLLEKNTIFLQEQIHEINEVNIKAQPLGKEKLFGKKNKNRGLSIGFGNAQLGCEIGSVISIKKETYLKSANFKLNHAEGDSLLFRVNIYHFDEGQIGENILKENIIIYAPQKRGILTVDLPPYELFIQQDVLLTLEWIKDDNGAGNEGITFDTKKSRKSNIWTKRTSLSPFKINNSSKRYGLKKKSLCFWLIGNEVK